MCYLAWHLVCVRICIFVEGIDRRLRHGTKHRSLSPIKLVSVLKPITPHAHPNRIQPFNSNPEARDQPASSRLVSSNKARTRGTHQSTLPFVKLNLSTLPAANLNQSMLPSAYLDHSILSSANLSALCSNDVDQLQAAVGGACARANENTATKLLRTYNDVCAAPTLPATHNPSQQLTISWRFRKTKRSSTSSRLCLLIVPKNLGLSLAPGSIERGTTRTSPQFSNKCNHNNPGRRHRSTRHFPANQKLPLKKTIKKKTAQTGNVFLPLVCVRAPRPRCAW